MDKKKLLQNNTKQNNVVKGQTQNRQIDKLFSFLKDYTNNPDEPSTLLEIITKLTEKIDEVDRLKWIPGEYKWMKTNTMPQEWINLGWKRVSLDSNYTLINTIASTTGTTIGSIAYHKHNISVQKGATPLNTELAHTDDGVRRAIGGAMGSARYGFVYGVGTPTENYPRYSIYGVNDPSNAGGTETTYTSASAATGSNDNNVAAGQYAQLYIYDPSSKLTKRVTSDSTLDSLDLDPLYELLDNENTEPIEVPIEEEEEDANNNLKIRES